MDDFNTLQEFMLHTKGVLYVLIVITLCGLAGFWAWLTARDKDYD
jgi:hypothetical protein